MPRINITPPPAPENNKPKNNLINKVKIFFANAFRSIASFFKIKNYIDNTNNTNNANNTDNTYEIKIAEQAKDIIPKHLDLGKDIKVEDITDLHHRDPETKKDDDYILGEGTYGKVQLVASRKQTIFPILIKKQFVDISEANIKASEEAKSEYKKNIKFDNISILDKKKDAVISKYKGESLRKLFNDETNRVDKEPLSNEIKASISYQLLKQITNLHEQGILHQDIKPDNILIDAKGKLSIIDLAGASQNSKKKQDYSAKYEPAHYTEYYTPPEGHIRNNKITQYFDCWSVGVIMYELYTGTSLLNGCYIDGNFKTDKITNTVKIALSRLKYKKNIPPEITNLISNLLKIEPSQRLTAEQALASKAFDDKLDIKKMTAIDLNTTHDKHFKNLVNLEIKLEEAKKSLFFGRFSRDQLTIDIKDEQDYLSEIQEEIQRRNNNN